MKIIRGTRNIDTQLKNPVISLGNFDGVHIGHQYIFHHVKNAAQAINGTPVVYTFEPHPLKVLTPKKCPPMLTSFHKKMELIHSFGIDTVICADFTREFADQQPRDFAKNILYKNIGVKKVFVGYDYTFGRGKEGTIDYLKKMGVEFGFDVSVVKPFKWENYLVSSTKIRELIELGDIEVANSLLGRNYSIRGKVVKGFKRGRVIGYPTANLEHIHELIPHTGVYVVLVKRGKNWYTGISNVGYNPTFNRDKLDVEAHLFDLSDDLYNEEIEVYFVKYLRKEKDFGSTEDLIKQIKKDVICAKQYLETKKDNFTSF